MGDYADDLIENDLDLIDDGPQDDYELLRFNFRRPKEDNPKGEE